MPVHDLVDGRDERHACRRPVVLGKPARGPVSEWSTSERLRSRFVLRWWCAEGHAICQLRGRSGRWPAAADHDRPDVCPVPDPRTAEEMATHHDPRIDSYGSGAGLDTWWRRR